MEFVSSAFARKTWRLGWTSQRQSPFCQLQSFGFYGQALHGETFHRNMVAGKILIVVFVVGVIKDGNQDMSRTKRGSTLK